MVISVRWGAARVAAGLMLLLAAGFLTGCGPAPSTAAPVAPLELSAEPVGGAVRLTLPVPARTAVYLAYGRATLALAAKDNAGRLVVTDGHPGRTYEVEAGGKVLFSYHLQSYGCPSVEVWDPGGRTTVVIPSAEGGYRLSFAERATAEHLLCATTRKGLVWSPPPPLRFGWSTFKIQNYPLQPWTVYLSPPGSGILDVAHARRLFQLPLAVITRDPEAPRQYVELTALHTTRDWVVYTTDVRAPGMNQAYYDLLGAYGLRQGVQRVLTRFHDTGGYIFGLVVTAGRVFWRESYPGPGTSMVVHGQVVDLSTGAAQKLSPSQLAGNSLQYTVDGQALRITWTQP